MIYFLKLIQLLLKLEILKTKKMEINQLKKELNISNKDIAEFFDLKPIVFANSTAKKRYENALCKFYAFVKKQSAVAKNE